jgi:hypothetical protein
MCSLFYLFIFKRDFGFPVLNHIYPHLAWIFHLIAIICWFAITETEMQKKGECDNEDIDPDEKLDLCGTSGPVIAIVQLVVQVVFSFYYTFIYWKREVTSSENPDESKS